MCVSAILYRVYAMSGPVLLRIAMLWQQGREQSVCSYRIEHWFTLPHPEQPPTTLQNTN